MLPRQNKLLNVYWYIIKSKKIFPIQLSQSLSGEKNCITRITIERLKNIISRPIYFSGRRIKQNRNVEAQWKEENKNKKNAQKKNKSWC